MLTSTDKSIASLKSLIVDLNLQLEGWSTKISGLNTKARSAISEKNKALAIRSLRSKKLYESMHLRTSETLASIESIYYQIEKAVDQVEVMKAIHASTKTLKYLNAEVGNVDTVEDALEELRKEMAQIDDLGSVISEAGAAMSQVDEGAIDEELEALENEDRARSNERASFEKNENLHVLENLKTPRHETDIIREDNWKDSGVHRAVAATDV